MILWRVRYRRLSLRLSPFHSNPTNFRPGRSGLIRVFAVLHRRWSTNFLRITWHFDILSNKVAALNDLENTNLEFGISNIGSEPKNSDEQLLRCIFKTILSKTTPHLILRRVGRLPPAHQWRIKAFLIEVPQLEAKDIENILLIGTPKARRCELCSHWYNLSKDMLSDWQWHWAGRHRQLPSTVIADTVGPPLQNWSKASAETIQVAK